MSLPKKELVCIELRSSGAQWKLGTEMVNGELVPFCRIADHEKHPTDPARLPRRVTNVPGSICQGCVRSVPSVPPPAAKKQKAHIFEVTF
jgi:hypothetical protein